MNFLHLQKSWLNLAQITHVLVRQDRNAAGQPDTCCTVFFEANDAVECWGEDAIAVQIAMHYHSDSNRSVRIA